MFFDRYSELCKRVGKSPTGVAIELNVSRATVNYWKNGNTPKQEILSKIAEYFGVSTDYLLGNTDIQSPANTAPTDEDIKFALFGGDGEITDDMYNEVKEFVKFVKSKYKKD